MKTKGQTSFTVVASVLAVVGFVLLLWFVVRLGVQDDAETQACRFSVLTRATAREAAHAYVPLKCTTQNICLRDGKGTCGESFAGEQFRDVKLEKRDDEAGNRETAREVEGVLAEEMYSCWSMMGEGKLDLFTSLTQKAGLEDVRSTCVICSRVALDVKEGRELRILGQVDLPAYLKSHKVPNSALTYLQAFTNPSVQAYSRVSDAVLEREFAEQEVREATPRAPEYAVVFMQVKPVDFASALKNVGSAATFAGGAFVLTPIPFKGKLVRAAGRGLLTLPGLVAAGIGAGAGIAYIWSNTDQSKQAAAGYCGEVTTPAGSVKTGATGADVTKGCSMVQVMPYDAEAINALCAHLESAP